jgi:hypothetical protein
VQAVAAFAQGISRKDERVDFNRVMYAKYGVIIDFSIRRLLIHLLSHSMMHLIGLHLL